MTCPTRRAPLPVDEDSSQARSKLQLSCGRIRVIQNAHMDDIHGLIRITPDYFASGSKDGSLKVWDFSGKLIASHGEKQGKIDYCQWITALAPIPLNRLLSGTRDGFFSVRAEDGAITSTFQHQSEQFVAGCKNRNQNRITCLAALNSKEIFIGMPTGFVHYNLQEKIPYSVCTSSLRDWVYCLHPLNDHQVLAATGTELEIWECKNAVWNKKAVIQSEKEVSRKGLQRPFISAISPLISNPNFFAAAVFDGSIRVRDIATAAEIAKFKEHEGRTWAVVNIDHGLLASCADDATVKFWDLRQSAASVLTLANHPGRISSLLPLENHQLITASCPDRVRTSAAKAELAFWDIRR